MASTMTRYPRLCPSCLDRGRRTPLPGFHPRQHPVGDLLCDDCVPGPNDPVVERFRMRIAARQQPPEATRS